MKVLMGYFSSESNAHVSAQMTYDEYIYKTGDDLLNSMRVRDIFENAALLLFLLLWLSATREVW